MKEIPAVAIMKAYNERFTPHLTLGEVKNILETSAFFGMPADLAAKIIHEAIERNKR